ncbi:MAG: HNH endonuclease [Elusimicrobiota bacterium]|jgi:hypothetical protein|nr:HNH endonuclease [Elusimicrobiota bacterium]
MSQIIQIDTKSTPSRVGRGILSLPKKYSALYPSQKCEVKIKDIYDNELLCSFSPQSSNHAEPRIGKLLPFFRKNNVFGGEEITLHMISNLEWRLIPKSKYSEEIKNSEIRIEKLIDDTLIDNELQLVSVLSGYKREKDYVINRLRTSIDSEIDNRKEHAIVSAKNRQPLPPYLKRMYKTISPLCICQVSGRRGFIMKNGERYIEFHHINPTIGHHPKNILMLCADIHRMFHYARLKYEYDNQGWLRNVTFPDMEKSYNISPIL